MKRIIIPFLLSSLSFADSITNNFPKQEIVKIESAIERNGLEHPDLRYIVYAIRKVENGRSGKEFGIMSPKAHDYDSQAGWCVCTVNKNYLRWLNQTEESDFIVFLYKKYAPLHVENDPDNLNQYWLKNLQFWLEKII